MAGHIHVSYGRADRAYVDRLVRYLSEAGLDVWHDSQLDISQGVRWDSVMRESVMTCAALVVVMSPSSDSSRWVDEEVRFALEQGKPVLPLLLEGFGYTQENPLGVRLAFPAMAVFMLIGYLLFQKYRLGDTIEETRRNLGLPEDQIERAPK